MTKRLACPPAPGPLEDYATRFDPLFARLAQRRGLRAYLQGLLLPRDPNKTLASLAGAEPVFATQHKADLADSVQRRAQPWTPWPVKRVYVPKKNGRRRPLGIPAIADRALQALTVNALEPEWEARFEPRSYGFRPGPGCHDAIKAIHQAGKGRNAKLPVKIAISSICAG
jgi:retron-type reverse transcriptase